MSGSAKHRKDSPLLHRSTFSHWADDQVRWSDTDLVGHVNNLSFSTYCETGRTHFLHGIITSNVDRGTFSVIVSIDATSRKPCTITASAKNYLSRYCITD